MSTTKAAASALRESGPVSGGRGGSGGPAGSWNASKAESNAKKHVVLFGETKTEFYEEHALWIPDPYNSITEDRFLIMELSSLSRILVRVHCVRKSGSSLRVTGQIKMAGEK